MRLKSILRVWGLSDFVCVWYCIRNPDVVQYAAFLHGSGDAVVEPRKKTIFRLVVCVSALRVQRFYHTGNQSVFHAKYGTIRM